MHITNAEWKIMELLWEREPWTVTELTKALKEEKNWKKQVITIMLQRMEDKGTVRSVKEGKAKQYFPAITRDEAEEAEASAVMEKAFSGSASLLISAIVRKEDISDKELDEICAMLGLKRE